MKVAGKYKIQSRLKPDEVLFVGTSEDMGASFEWHMGYLRLRCHPNPVLMNHVLKYGLGDLQWSYFPIEEQAPQETAVMPVEKETRRKVSKIDKT